MALRRNRRHPGNPRSTLVEKEQRGYVPVLDAIDGVQTPLQGMRKWIAMPTRLLTVEMEVALAGVPVGQTSPSSER